MTRWLAIRVGDEGDDEEWVYMTEEQARHQANLVALRHPGHEVHVLKAEAVATVVVGDRPVQWTEA